MTAIASISTELGPSPPWTIVWRAGRLASSGEISVPGVFRCGRMLLSLMKTVTRATSEGFAPAAARMLARFLKAFAACSSIDCGAAPVSGSRPPLTEGGSTFPTRQAVGIGFWWMEGGTLKLSRQAMPLLPRPALYWRAGEHSPQGWFG